MEAKMDPNYIEPIETATPAEMSDVAGPAGTAKFREFYFHALG
jgi:hypothetical protein